MTIGMARGAGGRIVGGRNPSIYSDDDGETWQEGEPFETTPFLYNQRRLDYVPYDGGRYLMYFEGGGVLDVVVSTDGVTFHSTGKYPQDCRVADIDYLDGVILIANDAIFDGVGGVICRSVDGGENWTVHELMNEGAAERTTPSALIRTDTEVIAFAKGGGSSFVTTDGSSWGPISVNYNGLPTPLPINARTLSGAFVSLMDSYPPKLARSEDGVEWTPAGDWTGYLNKFAPGYLPASSCP
jgi:hypothetical protein